MAYELAEQTQRADTAQKSAGEMEAAGEQATTRARLMRQLSEAKEELAHWRQAAVERTRTAAKTTDAVAHEHPWAAMGVAAGVGALVGWLLARR